MRYYSGFLFDLQNLFLVSIYVNWHGKPPVILTFEVFLDYRGFLIPADKNEYQIWILWVKIHKLKYKMPFLYDVKVKQLFQKSFTFLYRPIIIKALATIKNIYLFLVFHFTVRNQQ